jgi:hypothetical protein
MRAGYAARRRDLHVAVTATLLVCVHAIARRVPVQAVPIEAAQGGMMEASRLLQASAVLLVIAALGGIAMVAVRFGRSVNPPNWLAMLHGFLAAAGITLLGYAVFAHGAGTVSAAALVLLLLAALGGVALSLRYKWKDLLLPAWLVWAHGLAAVVGFAAVLYAAFAAPP